MAEGPTVGTDLLQWAMHAESHAAMVGRIATPEQGEELLRMQIRDRMMQDGTSAAALEAAINEAKQYRLELTEAGYNGYGG